MYRLSDTQFKKLFTKTWKIKNLRTGKIYYRSTNYKEEAISSVRRKCKTVLDTDELDVQYCWFD